MSALSTASETRLHAASSGCIPSPSTTTSKGCCMLTSTTGSDIPSARPAKTPGPGSHQDRTGTLDGASDVRKQRSACRGVAGLLALGAGVLALAGCGGSTTTTVVAPAPKPAPALYDDAESAFAVALADISVACSTQSQVEPRAMQTVQRIVSNNPTATMNIGTEAERRITVKRAVNNIIRSAGCPPSVNRELQALL